MKIIKKVLAAVMVFSILTVTSSVVNNSVLSNSEVQNLTVVKLKSAGPHWPPPL